MVAVKVLHGHLADSEDFITRFKREARSLGQLQHPNIVQVIDFDASGEMYFMVMDYIAGKTLRDYLDEKDVLSNSEALTLGAQLADALSYAHKKGAIHRDIKPSNVMFDDETNTKPVITDFGITRLLNDKSITMTGAMVGTPAYMSPEAVMGERVDGRSDIYSLGVILYEMLTGRAPYQGETPLSLVVKQVHEPLPSPLEHNPDLPLPIVYLLEKALAKSADERYQSADELLAAIQEAQQSLGDKPHGVTLAGQTVYAETVIHPDPPTTINPKQTQEESPPNRIPWIVGGVLAAIVIFAGIFLISRNNDGEGETVAAVTETAVSTTAPTTTPEPDPTIPPATDEPAVVADPTEAPPDPTVEPTIAPTETATAAALNAIPFDTPNRFGGVRFTDNGLTLQMNRVPQPPAGFQYELWLETTEGELLNGGPVIIGNGRVFTTIGFDENPVATINRVIMSIEPDETDAEEITGDIAFSGQLPDEFTSELRQILVDNGDGVGLLDNAVAQTAVSAQHAGFALDALAANDLTEAKMHLEHVVNILDGETGERFGDVNLDGQTQNPGNGVGVRVYLEKSRNHLETALQTDDVTIVQQQQGAEAITAVNNSLTTLENIFDNALRMLATDTVEEAQPIADELQAGLDELQSVDNQPTIAAAFAQTVILAEIPLVANTDLLVQPDPIANLELEQVGLVQISESEGENGRISLQLDQIPAPTADQQLVAWLQNSETDELLSLSAINIASEWGELIVETERDLLVEFDQLLISMEPAGQDSDTPGDILFTANLQTELAQQIQQLLVIGDDGKGALLGAEQQVGAAFQHYGFSQVGLNAGNLNEAKHHMEHVINILDGEDGELFGDVNQDGQTQNPGDGVGVRGYWIRVADAVVVMSETTTFTPNQQFNSELLTATAENNVITTLETIDQALKIIASDTIEEAQPFMENVGVLLEALVSGTDLDKNGSIDPLIGEAGIDAATNVALAINEVPIVVNSDQ